MRSLEEEEIELLSKEIILKFLDLDILEFMCAPRFRKDTFDKFKAELKSNELSKFIQINTEILHGLVGQQQDSKNTLMGAIPKLYDRINLRASEIVKLTESKLNLSRQDVAAIIIGCLKLYILKNTWDFIDLYTSPNIWNVLNQFKKFLTTNEEFCYMIANHLPTLYYFAQIYAKKYSAQNTNQNDAENNEYVQDEIIAYIGLGISNYNDDNTSISSNSNTTSTIEYKDYDCMSEEANEEETDEEETEDDENDGEDEYSNVGQRLFSMNTMSPEISEPIPRSPTPFPS